MTRVPVLAAIILFSLAFCGGADDRKQSEAAKVHVRIVNDCTGEDLGAGTVKVFERDSGDLPSGNFAGRFRQNIASNIPHDFYRLCAYTTGFATGCKQVPVYQPEVWVVLGLRFGGWLSTERMTGAVANVPAAGSAIWVRLVGIYSGFSVDAKVDQSGQFKMDALPGMYVLVTIQGDRVLDTRAVRIPASGPVTIALPREK